MNKNFNACDPSFVLVVWVIHDFEFEWLYWNRLSVKNYSLMYRQPNYMYFLHNYKLVYESSIWHIITQLKTEANCRIKKKVIYLAGYKLTTNTSFSSIYQNRTQQSSMIAKVCLHQYTRISMLAIPSFVMVVWIIHTQEFTNKIVLKSTKLKKLLFDWNRRQPN